MTNPNELTYEDWILLLDWLEEVIGYRMPGDVGLWFESEKEIPRIFALKFLEHDDSIPEKIRRALAEQKPPVTVYQVHNKGSRRIQLSIQGKGVRNRYIEVLWSRLGDPTGKHALIQATLEYIKGEGDAEEYGD